MGFGARFVCHGVAGTTLPWNESVAVADRTMETSLLNLLGVAMAHLALTAHERRVPGLPLDGNEIIAGCLKAGATGTRAVVANTLSAFWPKINTGEVSRAQLQDHIKRLAGLIKAAGGTVADSPSESDSCCASTAGERIAQQICWSNAAGSNGDHQRLCAVQNQQTLATLFDSILDAGPQLDGCLTAIATLLDKRFKESEVAVATEQNSAITACCEQISRDVGISMSLIEAIADGASRMGLPHDRIPAALIDRTGTALELLGELHHLADRAGNNDRLEATMEHIAKLVRQGALARAGCELAVLSRNMESSSEFPQRMMPDLVGTAFFPRLLAARARTAHLDGDPREAARLYERATLFWPRNDRIRRWQNKLQQAREIAAIGHLPDSRLAVLCEAAQIYASAGGLVSEGDCPRAWAEANLELGTLLQEIGDRECRPERYLAAALHFKPALDVFTRERDMDGWARSQVGLAHALRGQASFQGDVIVLRDAAFAYRASLGILTEDGSPETWYTVRSCLGDVLVRIAEETGDVDALQQASEVVMTLSESKPGLISAYAQSIGEIALGRTMLFLVESDEGCGDTECESVLNDAIDLISKAIDRADHKMTALELARAENALGSAYWLLHNRTGDSDALERSINAKLRSRDLYEHLDNAIEADALDEQIAAMQAVKNLGVEGPEEAGTPAVEMPNAPVDLTSRGFAGPDDLSDLGRALR